MPDGQVLEFSAVAKRFGRVAAVDGLTARVEPGLVTGFLGPNGAGKTTSLRMLLGLIRPTEGTATIGGLPYAKLRRPLQTVGAALEASSFHPGRSAASHLTVYAHAGNIPGSRVDEVLGLVGLSDVAGRKVGGFSLGMRQRLGLAAALLGDPGVLVLDEPANGLDPEGIRWMRGLLRSLAAEGRTVLISSHLLAEVQQTVDALLIITSGRLVFQGGIEDLADPTEYATVVDAPERAALVAAIERAGLEFEVLRNGLTVRGAEPIEIGAIAAAAGITLSALQRRGAGLEEIFLDLVSGARVHPSAGGSTTDAAAPLVPIVAPAESETQAVAEPAPVAEILPDPEPAPVAEPVDDPGEPAAVAEPVDDPGEPAAETDTDHGLEPDRGFETDRGLETDQGFEPDPEPEWATSTAAFAVARTGVIDIVPTIEQSADDAAAENAGVAGSDSDSSAHPVLPEPQPQPEQTGSMSWQSEPIGPAASDPIDGAAQATENDSPAADEAAVPEEGEHR